MSKFINAFCILWVIAQIVLAGVIVYKFATEQWHLEGIKCGWACAAQPDKSAK